MPIEYFIITVYCCIEEILREITNVQPLRSKGFAPKLTDAEVLTMEVVGEFMGMDTDKGIWEYFHSHWLSYFPKLGSRCNFVRQAANLWKIKQVIQEKLAGYLGAFDEGIHMCDGFPMPTCQFKRAYFSKIFKGEAAYGYCASKDEKYFGFKGNVLIDSRGIITGLTVTAANIDERVSLWDIIDKIKGNIIADKGLIGADFKEELQKCRGIELQTAVRGNMEETRSEKFVKYLISTRRLVETVIGQLSERFHIEKVRARDTWHLTCRVARKILAHTVAIFINRQLGRAPLQFEGLVVY